MTNIKYSKRFKLRNGERIDFCPECDYHITDTVNNSDSVYCPNYLFEVKMKTERIQQFKKAFTLYRRGGYSLAYRWKLYFIRDVRKKKLPNNFEK